MSLLLVLYCLEFSITAGSLFDPRGLSFVNIFLLAEVGVAIFPFEFFLAI